MQNLLDSLRREGRTFLSRMGIGWPGGSRIILIHVALLAVFGVFLPWRKGLEFTDPVILSAYLCMSVVFAAPSAAEAFADSTPASMTEAAVRIAGAVIYGECLVTVMLVAGIATVTATHPRATALFPPDWQTLAGAGALGITASLALGAAAAWITLRFSAGAARGALRFIFLLLLLAFFYWSRWLPEFAPTGTLICVVLAAAMLLGLRSLLKGHA
jgi:hypothetical protein